MIRRVDAATVRPLRHAVLRPGQPLSEVTYPADEVGAHFAAYDGDRLLGVASVFAEDYPDTGEPGWRLRGMAVDPAARGRGIGAALLAATIEYAAAAGGRLYWCNARTPVLGFYARQGLSVAGAEFEIPGGGPHHRMRRPLP